MDPQVSIVMITRNRGRDIRNALGHLLGLPERPPIIVVDNGSTDDTVQVARACGRRVQVLPLGRNLGGAGRNLGVTVAQTPCVAFSDDDSWWEPGALSLGAKLFDAHPHLGLLAARILAGPERQTDPVCDIMARGPLASGGEPGTRQVGIPVTSFIACGSIVRKAAFLQAGGFHPRFGVGGEEEVLALDLLRRGWQLAYRDELIAHHHPSTLRDVSTRRRRQVRNAIWAAWLRRPFLSAISSTWRVVSSCLKGGSGRSGLLDALLGLPWVLRSRDPVPASVDRQVQITESAFYSSR